MSVCMLKRSLVPRLLFFFLCGGGEKSTPMHTHKKGGLGTRLVEVIVRDRFFFMNFTIGCSEQGWKKKVNKGE